MKNIHILPTDKPSRLYIDNKGKYNLEIGQVDFKTFQNINITNDEEIKEGDWFSHKQINYLKISNSTARPMDAKKIILTTDQDLIKYGVQAIDDEFLEFIVKNSSCEEVEVIYEPKNFLDTKQGWEYKIIIPKEEPKQEKINKI